MAMFGNRRRTMAMPKIGMPAPAQIDIPDAPMMQPMGAIPQFEISAPQMRMPGERTQRVFDTIGQIGDILTGNPVTSQIIQNREAPAREAAARQQEQDDQWKMWLRRQEYERANQKPAYNDTVADFEFISKTLGADAARRMLENKTLPPPFVQRNEDGTSTVYPMGLPRGGGVTPSTIPQSPVGKLRPLGGPTPNASGNFLG